MDFSQQDKQTILPQALSWDLRYRNLSLLIVFVSIGLTESCEFPFTVADGE